MNITDRLTALAERYGFTVSETEYTVTVRLGLKAKSFAGCDRHYLACRYLEEHA